MTEIKRDENGNVLCPLCGGILKASFNCVHTVYQNGESDDYEMTKTKRAITCLKCGCERSDSWVARPDFLLLETDFSAFFDAIIENWQKHSLS